MEKIYDKTVLFGDDMVADVPAVEKLSIEQRLSQLNLEPAADEESEEIYRSESEEESSSGDESDVRSDIEERFVPRKVMVLCKEQHGKNLKT